ncbi:hypothetical protein ACFY3O_08580 [Streptomyces sp. NPDC001046]|uniref:hypothetical protein n=1 Tax=Streptomyces sp. NPDC001046 TaxID=3364543 RepID=UPI0036B66C1D
MGIRTLLKRTAAGTAHPPVPAFEAAASTVRVPFTLTAAVREATADLRQRLTRGGRSADPARADGGPTGPPGITGPRDLAALLGLDDPRDLPEALGLTGPGNLPAAPGPAGPACDLPAAVAPHGAAGAGRPHSGGRAQARRAARPPRSRTARGPARPWTRRARDYLTYVLALLPRPRPAHTTTITVYITTPGAPLSERRDGSAPHRRHGQDPHDPEPDATA